MDYHQKQIINNCCSILENIYDSLVFNEGMSNNIETQKLKNFINIFKYLPTEKENYSEDILIRSKQLKDKWFLCKNDFERIELSRETGEIIFLLEEDYTICNLLTTNKEAQKIFGDFLLDKCIGNSNDTETLLNILNIPYKII